MAKPEMNVLDVGANIGLYTVLMAHAVGPSGHVYAFEPFAPSASYLTENLERNRLSNVTLHRTAASDTEECSDFHVYDGGNDVYNSLGAASRAAEQLSSTKTISVRCETLDAFSGRSGLATVDILKIDVEGAEEKVIRGGEALLRRSAQATIMLEMYEPSALQCGCSTRRVEQFMRELGYSMHCFNSCGLLVPCSVDTMYGYTAVFKR